MIRIPATATLGEAARTMEREGVESLLVTDPDQTPVGVLTPGHVLAAVAASRHPDHGTVEMWMAPVIIDPDGARHLPDTVAGPRIRVTATR
jgi:signal-transduction protein with cAMP-binding, CBS, and nucleotidyltransferase domain